MTQEEMKLIGKAFECNWSDAFDVMYDPLDSAEVRFHRQSNLAILVTLVDFLRGDIKGVQSPLSDLARNQPTTSNQPTTPQIPRGHQDPNPIATECMKRLGELGLQSLYDIKGYKLDGCGHFLLHINGRFADTGWTNGDKRISVFMSIMDEVGITLNRID